jgi:hypothetical protein
MGGRGNVVAARSKRLFGRGDRQLFPFQPSDHKRLLLLMLTLDLSMPRLSYEFSGPGRPDTPICGVRYLGDAVNLDPLLFCSDLFYASS